MTRAVRVEIPIGEAEGFIRTRSGRTKWGGAIKPAVPVHLKFKVYSFLQKEGMSAPFFIRILEVYIMAELKIGYGTLENVTRLNGESLEPDNWRLRLIGQGLILLYEASGKHFMDFSRIETFKNDEGTFEISNVYEVRTSVGDLKETKDGFVLYTRNSIYTVSYKHNLSDIEQSILIVNA